MLKLIKNYIIKKSEGIPLNIYFTNLIFQKIFKIDRDCKFSKNFTSRVQCPEKIIIENNCIYVRRSFALSGGCYFQACGGIEIGEKTMFANCVTVVGMEHDLFDVTKVGKKGKVKIGKNCWIGSKATILTGVELGDNTIVGANAVVTKSYQDGNVVLAGIPAKVIKEIKIDK